MVHLFLLVLVYLFCCLILLLLRDYQVFFFPVHIVIVANLNGKLNLFAKPSNVILVSVVASCAQKGHFVEQAFYHRYTSAVQLDLLERTAKHLDNTIPLQISLRCVVDCKGILYYSHSPDSPPSLLAVHPFSYSYCCCCCSTERRPSLLCTTQN